MDIPGFWKGTIGRKHFFSRWRGPILSLWGKQRGLAISGGEYVFVPPGVYYAPVKGHCRPGYFSIGA